MPSIRQLLVAAAAAACALGPGGATSVHAQSPPVALTTSVDTLEIRAHTRFLADDLLEGRGTGTRGEHLAATYIESQAIRLGLAPISPHGYRLPVPLIAATIRDGTRLSLLTGDSVRTWRSPEHLVWNIGGAGAFRDFAGDLVFAGQPEEAEAALAGLELRGNVIVVTSLLGAAATRLVPDWIERGVSGVLVLASDPAYFDLVARSRGPTRYFIDAAVDDPVWQTNLPIVVVGPGISAILIDEIRARGTLPSRLAQRAEVSFAADRAPVAAANVGAMIVGSDAALRDEIVVYTAHFDHLGIGTPDERGDSIYNGFSDNAAGVAMLLAIAERLRRDPPARSVAFLFFTGEERGLLGSTHFAAYPAFALERVRAVINLDAGAPPAPPLSWGIAAGPGADAVVTAATGIAERSGWRVNVGEASPNSDHWPFAARGVPAIFLTPGPDWEGTTPGHAQALRTRWERYHQPGDEWHADFPFAGLGRYADFALAIGLAVAR